MSDLWKTLFLASLILSALLLFQLKRSEKEHYRLTEGQRALEDQLETIGSMSVKTESSEAKAGDKQKTESDAARKAEYDVLMSAWQKKFAQFSHRQNLRNVWTWYHEAIAKLNLPHDKQMRLLNLLRAREEAGYDASEAANSIGITDSHEINQAIISAKNTATEEMTALVGSAAIESIDNSPDLKGQEQRIDRSVGADLAIDGIPLTQEQETGLAQIYETVSKQYPINSDDGSNNPQQRANSGAAVLEKAAAILTPEQMTDLKNYIDWSNQQASFYEGPHK